MSEISNMICLSDDEDVDNLICLSDGEDVDNLICLSDDEDEGISLDSEDEMDDLKEENQSIDGDGEYNSDDEEEDDDDEESLYNKVICLLKEGGDLGALNIKYFKAYLRKQGLRISGTKTVCIQRIKEHWRIKDGRGEILYPQSSFNINCKGDVCQGDVVLFMQKVKEKFDNGRKRGTRIGRRTSAGQVVTESYGAARQQHTFTIEILWSKGIKKLPPLYPLLVKGRNLYRMKTLRQRWNNEAERQKVFDEKHKRGAEARRVKARRRNKTWSGNGGVNHQKNVHYTRSSEMRKTTEPEKEKPVDGRGKGVSQKRKTTEPEKEKPTDGRGKGVSEKRKTTEPEKEKLVDGRGNAISQKTEKPADGGGKAISQKKKTTQPGKENLVPVDGSGKAISQMRETTVPESETPVDGMRKTTESEMEKPVDGREEAISQMGKTTESEKEKPFEGCGKFISEQHAKSSSRGSQFSQNHINHNIGPTHHSYRSSQIPYPSQIEPQHMNRPFHFPGHDPSSMTIRPQLQPYLDTSVMHHPPQHQGFNHSNQAHHAYTNPNYSIEHSNYANHLYTNLNYRINHGNYAHTMLNYSIDHTNNTQRGHLNVSYTWSRGI